MEILVEILIFIAKAIGYFFAGLVIIFFLFIVLKDKNLWRYETRGKSDAFESGHIKIKLRCKKRRGAYIKISGKLKTEYIDKPMHVLINGVTIASFIDDKNDGSQDLFSQRLEIEKPNEDDVLSLLIDNREVFSRKLYLDT